MFANNVIRSSFFWLLVILAAMGMHAPTQAENWRQSLRAAVKPAVVFLKVGLEPESASDAGLDKPIHTGTAFVISPLGYAITALHVVEKDPIKESKFIIKSKEVFVDPTGSRIASFDVIGPLPAYDLALIKLTGDRADWRYVPVDFRNNVDPDTELYTLGFPSGDPLTSASGELVRTDGGDDLITSLNVNQGFSGAPVLSPSGCAIGVVASKEANKTRVKPIKLVNSTAVNFLGGGIGASTDPACDKSDYVQADYEKRLPRFETVKKLQHRLDASDGAISALQARTAVGVAATSPAPSSVTSGGANAVASSASCPQGQVVTGVTMLLGGTCHGHCQDDGRPVSSFQVICGTPSVSK